MEIVTHRIGTSIYTTTLMLKRKKKILILSIYIFFSIKTWLKVIIIISSIKELKVILKAIKVKSMIKTHYIELQGSHENLQKYFS